MWSKRMRSSSLPNFCSNPVGYFWAELPFEGVRSFMMQPQQFIESASFEDWVPSLLHSKWHFFLKIRYQEMICKDDIMVHHDAGYIWIDHVMRDVCFVCFVCLVCLVCFMWGVGGARSNFAEAHHRGCRALAGIDLSVCSEGLFYIYIYISESGHPWVSLIS